MRFVLLSLEFDAGTFSGNGIYACSQVGLQAEHCELFAVSPPPPPYRPPIPSCTHTEEGYIGGWVHEGKGGRYSGGGGLRADCSH